VIPVFLGLDFPGLMKLELSLPVDVISFSLMQEITWLYLSDQRRIHRLNYAVCEIKYVAVIAAMLLRISLFSPQLIVLVRMLSVQDTV